MVRPRKLTRVALAVTVVTLAAGLMPGQASAVPATPPRIVAKPHNVMVNTTIALSGRGFPARAKLKIVECSNTNWIVVGPAPCDTDNAISVHTDRHGRFTGSFKVELCPRTASDSGPITREKCYIGDPEPEGVDTITLVGAARIVVTYP